MQFLSFFAPLPFAPLRDTCERSEPKLNSVKQTSEASIPEFPKDLLKGFWLPNAFEIAWGTIHVNSKKQIKTSNNEPVNHKAF